MTSAPFLVSTAFLLGLMVLQALKRFDVAVTLFLGGTATALAAACLMLLGERLAPGSALRTFETANFIFGAG